MSRAFHVGGRPPMGDVLRRVAGVALLLAIAVTMAVFMAFLVTRDQAPIALALLAIIPGFVLFNRYPFGAVLLWLAIAQFIVEGEGGLERRVYWVIHRAMPLGVVVVMIVGSMLGTRKKLPRLGAAEFMIGGYIVASLLSVLYLSPTPEATFYHLFDRVIAPVGLYLVIRLAQIRENDLKRMLPVLWVIVAIQSFIGLVSWFAPGVLPNAWLGREGQRTIGSLGHPNVFGVTVLTCGALLFHAALTIPMSRGRRFLALSGFLGSLGMAFFTFGRANWLAGIVLLLGLFAMYPRQLLRIGVATIPVLVLALASGLFATQVEQAQNRFLSDQSAESALSRLPVVYASLQMFEAKPLSGWGYSNFDLYDRQFQASIEGIVVPEKDHASHNLYLTIMAEQGTIGIVLYLGPAFVIGAGAFLRRRRLPPTGFVSQRLMGVLVLLLGVHFTVNNFANMRIVYGLGLWWVTLALLASVTDLAADEPKPRALQDEIARIPLEGLIQRVEGRVR